MQFSVLALTLSEGDVNVGSSDIDVIAEFVARENVTCVLFGCRQVQEGEDALVPGEDANVSTLVQKRLADVGLKYEAFWAGKDVVGSRRRGSSLLSQLPILGAFDHTAAPSDEQRSSVAGARLALAPTTLIDVYSGTVRRQAGPDGALAAVSELFQRTDQILEERQESKPRRRGPIRRPPEHHERAVQTRFVCFALSGWSEDSDERAGESAAAGFLRVDDPQVLFPQLFLKPAIKPVATVPQVLQGIHGSSLLMAVEL